MTRAKSQALAVVVPAAPMLSPQQDQALCALISGQRQKEAAQLAGVAPETVSRWLSNDALFVAELHRRRQEVWDAHSERMRRLVGSALDVLEDILLDPDDYHKTDLRYKAAIAVLSSAGIGAALRPGGPSTPEAVEAEWQQESTALALMSMTFGR